MTPKVNPNNFVLSNIFYLRSSCNALLHGLLCHVTTDESFSNVLFQFVSGSRVPPGDEFVFGNLAIVMSIDTFKYSPSFRVVGKWDPQHGGGILEVNEIDVTVSRHIKRMKEITNIRNSSVYKDPTIQRP